MLAREGFSQTDINDATFAYRANKDKVVVNDELAKSIVSAESNIAVDRVNNLKRKDLHYFYPGGGRLCRLESLGVKI